MPITEARNMILRPGLAFIPLDDELVVFCEASQRLVGLNKTAALIVEKLRDGVAASNLPAVIAAETGATLQEAARWIADTSSALGSQGLWADSPDTAVASPSPATDERLEHRRASMPPLEPFEPQAQAHYRLLGTCALIRCAHPAQMRMVDSVIGHFKSEETAEPSLIMDISAWPWGDDQLASRIYCNGEPEARAGRLSMLGPLVKTALWTTAVNAYDFLLDLHAGVVGKDGRCILLPAEAGSGKSSLTAALTHSGFGYYSDEVALIGRGTFQVPPVPLSICVKNTGWDLMSRYYPEISSLPTHQRDDQKVVRYVPPHPQSVQKVPAQVSHIFFPLYSKDQPTRLEPLSRQAAFARLMDQCLALRQRLDQDNVRELVRWIAGIDCYALTFSSLEEAVAGVKDVLAVSKASAR